MERKSCDWAIVLRTIASMVKRLVLVSLKSKYLNYLRGRGLVVKRLLPKEKIAGSNPVARSKQTSKTSCSCCKQEYCIFVGYPERRDENATLSEAKEAGSRALETLANEMS